MPTPCSVAAVLGGGLRPHSVGPRPCPRPTSGTGRKHLRTSRCKMASSAWPSEVAIDKGGRSRQPALAAAPRLAREPRPRPRDARGTHVDVATRRNTNVMDFFLQCGGVVLWCRERGGPPCRHAAPTMRASARRSPRREEHDTAPPPRGAAGAMTRAGSRGRPQCRARG